MDTLTTFGLPGIAAGFMPSQPGATLQVPSSSRLLFEWLDRAAEEAQEPEGAPPLVC